MKPQELRKDNKRCPWPDCPHGPECVHAVDPTQIPERYLPSGVAASFFDPEVLRLAAEAANADAWNHEIPVKTWVLLHLLDLAGFGEPAWKRARGAAPRQPGEPRSEERIRALRGDIG